MDEIINCLYLKIDNYRLWFLYYKLTCGFINQRQRRNLIEITTFPKRKRFKKYRCESEATFFLNEKIRHKIILMNSNNKRYKNMVNIQCSIPWWRLVLKSGSIPLNNENKSIWTFIATQASNISPGETSSNPRALNRID